MSLEELAKRVTEVLRQWGLLPPDAMPAPVPVPVPARRYPPRRGG